MDEKSAATITFNFFTQFDGPGLQNIWHFIMLKDNNHGNSMWKQTLFCLAEPLDPQVNFDPLCSFPLDSKATTVGPRFKATIVASFNAQQKSFLANKQSS